MLGNGMFTFKEGLHPPFLIFYLLRASVSSVVIPFIRVYSRTFAVPTLSPDTKKPLGVHIGTARGLFILTWCPRRESNSHVLTDTRSLVLRVCQFHHPGGEAR